MSAQGIILETGRSLGRYGRSASNSGGASGDVVKGRHWGVGPPHTCGRIERQ
jgi:hypothetical protein